MYDEQTYQENIQAIGEMLASKGINAKFDDENFPVWQVKYNDESQGQNEKLILELGTAEDEPHIIVITLSNLGKYGGIEVHYSHPHFTENLEKTMLDTQEAISHGYFFGRNSTEVVI